MKFRRVKIKAIISILIILILIGSSMIMNVSGPNSIESKTEIEENQGVLSTSRSASINVKNFTDFSNGHLVENTRIDTNGHMGLTWEPPKNPYETDENTLLLSHFDNMYEGEEGEISKIINKNCMGFWDFDEGTGTILNDRTDNENHGKIINGATWVKMPSGSALGFDGTDDYVTLPDIPLTNLTISHWVKANDVTGAEILTRRNGDGIPCNYQTQIYSNKFQFSRYLGSWDGWSTTNSLNTGQWYFLTATVEGGTLKLYIDGNLDSIHIITAIDPTGTQTTLLGKNRASTNWFDGIIDGVSIYNHPKSAEEIKADYNNQISYYLPFEIGKYGQGINIRDNITIAYPIGLNPGLNCAGLWRFDEGTGTTAKDISGNGNDGTIQNSPQWVEGITGKALKFDGVDDYIDCGNDSSLNYLTDFTLETWINLPNPADGWYKPIISKHTNDGALNSYAEFNLQVQNNGNLNILMGNGVGYGISISGGILQADTWHHVAFTIKDTSAAIYLNGNCKETGVFSGTRQYGQLPVQISRYDNDGAGGFWQKFKGIIDEIAIYNHAKTAKEIYGDYLAAGQDNFNIEKGTLELYVKPDWNGNDGENHTIFFTGAESNNDSFFIYKSDNGYLKFLTSDNQSNIQNNPQVNINNWKANTWYHLAFTWDVSGSKQIYIDGYLQAETINGIMPNRTYSEVYIGSILEHYPAFDGVIDEVRISDKIRTADELREYDNQGIYESQGIDVGEAVSWEKISWMATTPPSTDLYLQTRISADNATWSEWMGNISQVELGQKVYLDKTGDPINATNSQYLQWRAILKSSDGIFSPTLEKVSITWNRLPKASNVKVTPSNPTVLDDLTMSYDYSDADLHSESDTTLEWYVRRGSEFIFSGYTSQTLSASRTARGERWLCKVIPHDGKDFGVSVNSNIVTIGAGPIYRIEVTPGNITLTADETVTFSAKAYDAADNEITTSFEWDIKGNGTVDQTGKFVPEKAGVHAISATAAGISGYSVVEVGPGEFTNANILPEKPTITTDDMLEFEAMALDAKENNIANYSTTWSTTGGGIIDPEIGIYDASTPGDWKIFANVTIEKIVNISGNISYDNKSLQAETLLIITPGKLEKITIDSSTLETNADSELQFTATGYDMDNNQVGLDLMWWAENGTITSEGRFIPHAVGTWEIRASGIGSKVFASITINVTEGKISNLILEPSQCILAIGEKCSFYAYVFDGKGNRWEITEGITWSASDTTLGTISNSGTFEAIKDSELKIQAEFTQDGLDSAITAEANIFIKADEKVEEDLEEELEEEQKTKKAVEQQNSLFLIIIIILIIIILVLLILFALSRRKKEPEEKEEEQEAEGEEDEWEVEEEVEEESEPETEEVELTEGEEGGWELEEEPEPAAEVVDTDMAPEFVVKPEVEEEIKKPPKKPIKGKMPKKGKLPGQKKKVSRQRVLKPVSKGKQASNRPMLHTMDEAVKCNICLGYIKPGLNAVTCVCGKHFHEKCAERLSDCPVCEASLQDPENLLESGS